MFKKGTRCILKSIILLPFIPILAMIVYFFTIITPVDFAEMATINFNCFSFKKKE